jgi:hypothetical protein
MDQNTVDNIEYLLFQQVNKPKNYFLTKINNVYSNRYRINIYCEDEIDSLVKRKICASYFCVLSSDKKLDIVHGNPLPIGDNNDLA